MIYNLADSNNTKQKRMVKAPLLIEYGQAFLNIWLPILIS